MTTGTKVLIGLGASIALFAAIVGGSLIGTYNSFVTQENGLVAQYKQNQNNYSNYFNKLKEVAQVPSMQSDALSKLYKEVMAGRYGKDGSKAVFQVATTESFGDPSASGSEAVNVFGCAASR